MIKAIIADVDGVMVGKQEGVNFPLPHTEVIDALAKFAQNGLPIVLCTGKYRAAIDAIITRAHLNNPHITDGGALIIDPLGETKVIQQTTIDRAVVQDYLAHETADTELYSATSYFVQRDSYVEVLQKHSQLLQTKPVLVDNLAEVAAMTPIIKMISFADDDSGRPAVEAQVRRLGNRLNFIWTSAPFLAPHPICVMTAPEVSKEEAAAKVARDLGIAFDEILGIGDTPADWDFMKLCGYVATVGDNPELRCLASQKDHWYAGGSVDDNALLDIFDHFGLRRL